MKRDIRQIRLLALAALFGCAIPAISADPPPLPSEWSFDNLKLKNGALLKGLIVEETPTAVRFQRVHRLPGRPTICMTSLFFRSEIDKLEKLSEADREVLKNRLKEIDPTGEGERKRMETLELKAIDWHGKPKAAWRYDSDCFSLTSNAPEEIVRRAAVRLEQIYAAYASFLPPRFPGGKPTTVVLYPTLEEYQKLLAERGWKLQNPAYFDPNTNRIVCGSNLLEHGKDLEKARKLHAEHRAELDSREAEYRKFFSKKPQELMRYLQEIAAYRRKIAEADRLNDANFDRETRRLFHILYHEAFHAYAANFVYPGKREAMKVDGAPAELPRWLNEGLAQVFESALVEAGELRVDLPDKDRLRRTKEAVLRGELMPIRELLGVGAKQFLVAHSGERNEAEKAYLAAWALATYLTFDRRLIGTSKLDEYIRAVGQGADAEVAFSKLVGQPLGAFEKQFHEWLKKLPSDASLLEFGGKSKMP
jgi:Protein of unknown function (DUF1570)